jgi:hypothetical protein
MELTGSRAIVATAKPSGRRSTVTAGAMLAAEHRRHTDYSQHDMAKPKTAQTPTGTALSSGLHGFSSGLPCR